jgi:hypothetical protein
LGDIDYNRYGFGPEKSFFSNVPQRAAKGGSMAVTRPAKSYAVQGAGDGRSDDIPAVLSDGEYVMDAETVALLGNGSNKAGAAQLDRFRANVRKHKGKELAKGRFSVNAKNPQAYMAGGRLGRCKTRRRWREAWITARLTSRSLASIPCRLRLWSRE